MTSDEKSQDKSRLTTQKSVHDVSPNMFLERVKTSKSINKFAFGNGLTLEELDKIMSMLTLVNGLMLTIPYNLFQCLGHLIRNNFAYTISNFVLVLF